MTKLEKYEAEKKALERQNLTSNEYEKALAALIRRLKL